MVAVQFSAFPGALVAGYSVIFKDEIAVSSIFEELSIMQLS
ncbi:MAG: hypothetical protein QCH99_07675 [Candidatus Bathyarchaeota archaeon]|nr:hypothetical protein [Candidatus Bathyarchaeum tardum]